MTNNAPKKPWRIRPRTKQQLASQIDKFGWRIGDHTYGTPKVFEHGHANLKIGRFTSIGPEVTIVLGNHKYSGSTTYPFTTLREYWPSAPRNVNDHWSRGDVVIGNDVWIGAQATILSGVKIGNGCVIGAGSVVTRSFPSYLVIAGNPAKLIKRRHSVATSQALEEIAWWNWPEEKIDEFLPLIMSDDVEAFIAAARAAKERESAPDTPAA